MTTFAADASAAAAADQAEDLSMERETLRKKERDCLAADAESTKRKHSSVCSGFIAPIAVAALEEVFSENKGQGGCTKLSSFAQ